MTQHNEVTTPLTMVPLGIKPFPQTLRQRPPIPSPTQRCAPPCRRGWLGRAKLKVTRLYSLPAMMRAERHSRRQLLGFYFPKQNSTRPGSGGPADRSTEPKASASLCPVSRGEEREKGQEEKGAES